MHALLDAQREQAAGQSIDFGVELRIAQPVVEPWKDKSVGIGETAGCSAQDLADRK